MNEDYEIIMHEYISIDQKEIIKRKISQNFNDKAHKTDNKTEKMLLELVVTSRNKVILMMGAIY